ncbi:MAG: hypothetical protein JW894_08340 [Bacteroidales bacterium]|nr:hypothetical protein [Bacteroidales bacterium]
MKIAHLILAHKDPEHIKRLARVLSQFSDVYIHIDLKVDELIFRRGLENYPNVFFTEKRIKCFWGGWSLVAATMVLLQKAVKKTYDRYVLLQGLDYIIKSPADIIDFYTQNSEIEFIRGCNISESKDKYFTQKCRQLWFFDNRNIFYRIYNKLNNIVRINLRKSRIYDDKVYDLFYGSAQWALTYHCAEYITEFYEHHSRFNRWFKYALCPDELYFHTIVLNSEYRLKTVAGGPEKELRGLVNWRNLHYFEYPKQIRIFTELDLDFLKGRNELYIRKVTTSESGELLDRLDNTLNKI